MEKGYIYMRCLQAQSFSQNLFLQQQYQGIGRNQKPFIFLHFWPILSSLDWKLFANL
jgi:hypothetical protein